MAIENLEELKSQIGECQRCGLHKNRTNLVFGMGNPDARLMFVGEAPGRVEDAQGLPFVGPAGKLLDELLGEIGLKRDDVYIANILKCRPPGNRDPQAEEMEICEPFLREQIRIIKPVIVSTLGRFSTSVLLQKNVQMSTVHGKKFDGPGYFLVPCYHPAAALYTPSKKDTIAEDLRQVSKYLEEGMTPPEGSMERAEQMGLF